MAVFLAIPLLGFLVILQSAIFSQVRFLNVYIAPDMDTALREGRPFLEGKLKMYARWGQARELPEASAGFGSLGFDDLRRDRVIVGRSRPLRQGVPAVPPRGRHQSLRVRPELAGHAALADPEVHSADRGACAPGPGDDLSERPNEEEATMATNAEMMKRAYQILPGASLGTYYLPERYEFVVKRGAASRVYDVEGRGYIDYVLGSGPMVVGHAHPEVACRRFGSCKKSDVQTI